MIINKYIIIFFIFFTQISITHQKHLKTQAFSPKIIESIENFFTSLQTHKKLYCALAIYIYLGKKINILAKELLSKKYFFLFFLDQENELHCAKEILKKELDFELFSDLKKTEEKLYYFKKYRFFLFFFCIPPLCFIETKNILFSIQKIEKNCKLLTSETYTEFKSH